MRKLSFVFIFLLMSSIFVFGQSNNETVVDIDSNIYHTVKIGKQTWMVENLRTSRYRNGDTIPCISDSKAWNYATTGGYCFYKNDEMEEKVYGKIYNWYAVNDSRKIAPDGWHVATLDDWKKLIDFLGGNKKAGGKLKEKEFLHWKTPNKNASNINGFTALPGGYRFYNGNFGFLGETGAWWVATEHNTAEAWSICIRHIDGEVLEMKGIKANGFYVRCVKDN